MSEYVSRPRDQRLFDALTASMGLLVQEARLPDWPFTFHRANVDLCQFSHAVEGSFGPVLRELAAHYKDDAVTVVVLDPSPAYYREEYGSYPVARLPREGIEDSYWETMAYEPDDDPTGAMIFTANVAAIVGSSARWAVWAERSWDLALVASDELDGPWLRSGVPFVSVEDALASFTEPDFKIALPADVRGTFIRNLRERASGLA